MDQFENIIKNNDIAGLQSLINNGYELDTSHLEKALKYHLQKSQVFTSQYDKYQIINEILKQKVNPDLKCFLKYLDNMSADKTLIKIKNDCGFHSGINISEDNVFQLLINYGYKLSQTDFLFLTQNYFYLDDIKKYNLVLDDYIMHECERLYFFPYHEIIPSKKAILYSLSESPEIKIYKNMEKKYNVKPDFYYIVVLMNTQKAPAIKTIEYIHKKYIDLTAKLFCDVCSKINNKTENNNFVRYYKLLMDKKKFDFDYDNYGKNYNNTKIVEREKLFSHITKNNENIKKCFDEFYGVKIFDENISNQNKIYENIIAKYNVEYDINLLKVLCFSFPRHNGLYIQLYDSVKNFIYYIMKKYNIEIDDECLIIMKSHYSMKMFF
jgi:hypothetical protein